MLEIFKAYQTYPDSNIRNFANHKYHRSSESRCVRTRNTGKQTCLRQKQQSLIRCSSYGNPTEISGRNWLNRFVNIAWLMSSLCIVSAEYILPCSRGDPAIELCIQKAFNHLRPYLVRGKLSKLNGINSKVTPDAFVRRIAHFVVWELCPYQLRWAIGLRNFIPIYSFYCLFFQLNFFRNLTNLLQIAWLNYTLTGIVMRL